MKVSISVLTYNSSEVVSECIDSILFNLSNKIEYEINVLNNGSSDNTKEIVLSKKGNINYYENVKNESFTKSFNFLLSKSNADFYCMTSDDIIFQDEIFDYCSQYYANIKNELIVLAPKTTLPNNNLDRINKKELKEKDLLFAFTIVGNLINYSTSGLNQSESVNAEVLQDSCLFFSNAVKPSFVFNEKLKFYFTEDALAKDLLNKNYFLKYDTNINVKHYLKVGTKKSKNIKMNLIYFKDCIMYSSIYSNKLFHYFLFIPLIYLTIFLKYIKWKLNPEHYV